MADGSEARVKDTVRLHVCLLDFSWDHEFKVLNEGPFSAILVMDFLQRTQMRVDLSSRTYCFAFASSSVGSFCVDELQEGEKPYLQHLCGEVAGFTTLAQPRPKDVDRGVLMDEFPSLFSTSLGNAKRTPYDIELSDTKPVRRHLTCVRPLSYRFSNRL